MNVFPNWSLLLIMACFWTVFLLVWALLIKPLGAVLDERERRITAARATLAGVQETTNEALARYDRELAAATAEAARDRAARRAAGEAARREKLEAARGRAQQRLAALGRDIEATAAVARADLRSRAQSLAHALAERLIGRRLAS